jgi:hypothetical protein
MQLLCQFSFYKQALSPALTQSTNFKHFRQTAALRQDPATIVKQCNLLHKRLCKILQPVAVTVAKPVAIALIFAYLL